MGDISGEDAVIRTALYHINNKGWPGIGYHFFLPRRGRIFQTNLIETISYHVAGRNRECVGICLEGDYNIDLPTDIMITNLIYLRDRLRSLLRRDVPLLGHCEVAIPSSPTSCPGIRWLEWKGRVI